MKRILGAAIAVACAGTIAGPAVAQSPAPAVTNAGYDWAAPALRNLVAHYGWPASDQGKLGRLATRRELARGLAELMTARGEVPPADLVRPSDVSADDPDVRAISWVSTERLLGAPGAAFDPDGTVTTRTAEAAIVRIFGLETEARALTDLHTENGTRVRVPAGFAVEVLGGELGLRHDYATRYDDLATYAGNPMPLAELAGMIDAAIDEPSWNISMMSQFDSIVLPNLSTNQRTVITAALAEVGMPYIWGGTSPHTQSLFGATVAGGFDCSGLVWWSFKLSPASHADGLGRDLVGRTADAMAWEDPSETVSVAKLRPGDLVFFGSDGAKTPRGDISHVAIALGNGWVVQSTGSRGGVSVSNLATYWPGGIARARRPAAMDVVTAVAVKKVTKAKAVTSSAAAAAPAAGGAGSATAAGESLVPSGSSSGSAQAPAP